MGDIISSATIRVLVIAPVSAGRPTALAYIELTLGGVAIEIHGVQVRADDKGTEITLPRYRAPDCSWRSALSLPDDLRGPMGDAVISAAMEALRLYRDRDTHRVGNFVWRG